MRHRRNAPLGEHLNFRQRPFTAQDRALEQSCDRRIVGRPGQWATTQREQTRQEVSAGDHDLFRFREVGWNKEPPATRFQQQVPRAAQSLLRPTIILKLLHEIKRLSDQVISPSDTRLYAIIGATEANELSRPSAIRFLVALSLLALLGICGRHLAADSDRPAPAPRAAADPDALTFVRIKYDSTGGFGESWYRYEGRDWERWETDYPRAEKNLILRLRELTSMRVNPEPIVLRLTDDRLFDHPFIFMSDVGWQLLSRRERDALERYLDSGGFLWIDDFWGEAEWKNMFRNIGTIRSDWKWRQIADDHEILNIVYPLKGCPQVPARIFFAQSGLPFDPPQVHRYPNGGISGVSRVHFMGLFDRDGRLMAVATHNTDIADGWEREGESKEFFDRFSIQSYAITINILVYALTH